MFLNRDKTYTFSTMTGGRCIPSRSCNVLFPIVLLWFPFLRHLLDRHWGLVFPQIAVEPTRRLMSLPLKFLDTLPPKTKYMTTWKKKSAWLSQSTAKKVLCKTSFRLRLGPSSDLLELTLSLIRNILLYFSCH